MGILKLEKGQILHKAGSDEVNSIEILVKGSIKVSNQNTNIVLTVGAFAGAVEKPGKPYVYTYEALEESAVYSYPFESLDDIPNIIRSNPKIAPILASTAMSSASAVCAVFDQEYDIAISEYEQLMADYAD